ncbi:MAG: flavodoxin domain-containing protein [Nanoarchaeota archaeon]
MKAKTLVVYKSVSGFTERYARWIADELQADLLPQAKADQKILERYDLIVYGGGLHVTAINGFSKIRKILGRLGNRKAIVFVVGASPDPPLGKIKEQNFKGKELPLFYLRGGFNFSQLDFPNKVIMYLFIQATKRKAVKTKGEKDMITSYAHPTDFTGKEHIRGLVRQARVLLKA